MIRIVRPWVHATVYVTENLNPSRAVKCQNRLKLAGYVPRSRLLVPCTRDAVQAPQQVPRRDQGPHDPTPCTIRLRAFPRCSDVHVFLKRCRITPVRPIRKCTGILNSGLVWVTAGLLVRSRGQNPKLRAGAGV